MVGVVASVTAADLGEVSDEFDARQPLDLLEAELDLVAQPQRCAVAVGQPSSPFMSYASMVRW